MECGNYQLHISRLVDNELDAVSAESVRTHMAGCPECLKFYERVMSVGVELRALADASGVPEVNSLVVKRIARHRRSADTPSFVPLWIRVPVMAALVLIAVGLGHVAGTSMKEIFAPIATQEAADVATFESAPSFADVAMQIAYEEPVQ